MLVPLIDQAVPTLKLGDADSIPSLNAVANFATVAGRLFDKMGLIPAAIKPVVYEGRASNSQLKSLFARYAAASVLQTHPSPSFLDNFPSQPCVSRGDTRASLGVINLSRSRRAFASR